MQPKEYEALSRHFLTIATDDVVAHECAAEDIPCGRKRTGPEPDTAPQPIWPQLHRRKHCRSVHDECCEDLWKVDDPAKFYFALYQLIFSASYTALSS